MLKKRKLLSELLHILFVFFHHEIPDRNTKDIFLFFRESFRSMETLDQVEKRGSTQSGNSNISRFYNFFPWGLESFFLNRNIKHKLQVHLVVFGPVLFEFFIL